MSTTKAVAMQRAVEYTIKSTRFGPTHIPGKEHYRIIGSTDIDGKGTNHALASLDPFVFLDESLNPAGVAGLGGGGHPHAGLTAITYLNPNRLGSSSANGALQPWDNFNATNQPVNNAGGVYVIASGRGVVHDERNITSSGVMHQFQLWVDPGHKSYASNNETEDSNLNLPVAQASLHPPKDIPIARGDDLGGDSSGAGDASWCRVIIGSQFGHTSPTASPIIGGMLYLHLSLPASGSTVVKIPAGFRGIALCIEGEALIGATKTHLSKRDAAVLSPGIINEGSELVISNPGNNEEMQVLLAAGPPQHSGPLYKSLGNGGAIFAASEDAARVCMKRFEADPDNFGK
jgi:redox-sensitive bicupin YhaK (pirin superfamily)